MQDLVKVEAAPELSALKGANKNKIATNKDLPPGTSDKWKARVIPTLTLYIGGRQDVWSVKDTDGVSILQQIWDFNYGAATPYKMEPKATNLFGLVSRPLFLFKNI